MGIESKAAAKARIARERRTLEMKDALKKYTPYILGGSLAATVVNTLVDPFGFVGGVVVGYGAPEANGSIIDTLIFPVLGVTGTGLVGSVLLAAGYKVFAAKQPVSGGKKPVTAATYAQQWEELHRHRNDLMVKWAQYETDVALMIDYPIMTDYSDPIVGKVITAMQGIRNAEMLAVDESSTPVYGSVMLSAVNKFEAAFAAAEKYARRYGQTKLDPREQRKLSAARTALNIILDEQSPAHEVEAAYKSLRGSLKGIIDMPQQAVLELEAKVRRELVAL